jgi:hypothetical protein
MCCHLVFCVLFISSRAVTTINYVDWKWQDTSQPERKALLTLQGLDSNITRDQRSSTVGQTDRQIDRQHWYCRLRKMAPLLRVLSALKIYRVVENITFYRFTTLPGRDGQHASLSTRGARAPARCRYFWCAVSLETSLAESRACASCFASCIVYLRASRTTKFWLHCYIDSEFEYVRTAHLLRCGILMKPRQNFY